jgi:hypothetical protein
MQTHIFVNVTQESNVEILQRALSIFFVLLHVTRALRIFLLKVINASIFIASSINRDSLISLILYKKMEALECHKFQPVSIDLFITLGKWVKIRRSLLHYRFVESNLSVYKRTVSFNTCVHFCQNSTSLKLICLHKLCF